MADEEIWPVNANNIGGRLGAALRYGSDVQVSWAAGKEPKSNLVCPLCHGDWLVCNCAMSVEAPKQSNPRLTQWVKAIMRCGEGKAETEYRCPSEEECKHSYLPRCLSCDLPPRSQEGADNG